MKVTYTEFKTGATSPTAPKTGVAARVEFDDGRPYVAFACLDWFGPGSGRKSAEDAARIAINRRVEAEVEDMF